MPKRYAVSAGNGGRLRGLVAGLVCCTSLIFAGESTWAESEQERRLLLDSLTDSLLSAREPAPAEGPGPRAKVEEDAGSSGTRQPADQDPSQFSKPVQELMQYLADLRTGAVAFIWRKGMTGEEAARQLGYTRLFASSYEELILSTKARIARKGDVSLEDVIADYEMIVHEEQIVDQLMKSSDTHRWAIAYLRALQNGDVTFPDPSITSPSEKSLLAALRELDSTLPVADADPVLAKLYAETRSYLLVLLRTDVQLNVYDVIQDFRRQLAAYPAITNSRTADRREP